MRAGQPKRSDVLPKNRRLHCLAQARSRHDAGTIGREVVLQRPARDVDQELGQDA
jgi:hypothetical protein